MGGDTRDTRRWSRPIAIFTRRPRRGNNRSGPPAQREAVRPERALRRAALDKRASAQQDFAARTGSGSCSHAIGPPALSTHGRVRKSMNMKRCWLGYLEAGSKSTPVLHDPALESGNDATIYLFNLARNVIVEYHRATVEPKLRALRDDESDQIKLLREGYQRARKDFEPREARPAARPPRAVPDMRPSREADDDTEFALDNDFELAVEED
jgi:hypothetical protein